MRNKKSVLKILSASCDCFEVSHGMAGNVSIDVTMSIKLIEKQVDGYRLNIGNNICLLVGLDLFIDGLFPVKRTEVNGVFGWYVARKFVSYKRVEKVINDKNKSACLILKNTDTT